MTIHLLKIAAGIGSVSDLNQRFEAYGEFDPELGFVVPIVTRNVPRQREALMDGGSIYWIIKGLIQVRSEIIDLQEGEGSNGRRLCHIYVSPKIQRVVPTKRRGFQGWRYLQASDALPDIEDGPIGEEGQDVELAGELKELGLL